jgi:hypothetical protein
MEEFMKKRLFSGGIISVLLVVGLVFAGCDDGSNGGNTTFMVSYDAGDGSGTPPTSQNVTSGTTIYLPGQGNMTAPSGKNFTGWRTGGQNYSVGSSYTVSGNTTFIAQWDTGSSGGGGDTAVTFSSVTANGSSSQSTTQLTLTFSQAITGLSASDISLSGVSVTKGTLSGSGPTYTLGISGQTAGGTLTVAVAKSG